MGLADRIEVAEPRHSRQGCRACTWYATQPPAARVAFITWVDAKLEIRQLYDMCVAEGLDFSYGAFCNHLRVCTWR